VWLKWSSEDIIEEIIEPTYFYTESAPVPLKVSAIDQNSMSLGQLQENENCFFNTNIYKAQDVPVPYQQFASILL